MAKKANIAAVVGISGEKEFRQAITGINSDMKVLTSEMKKVTSEFTDNSKSVDALTAKDKVLNEQIEKQKDKVEALRKAMENSKEQYPDNEKKLNDWKSSLNSAEAKLFDLTHEVDTNKKALEEAKNPTVQLAKEVKDFGNAADTAGKHSLKMGDIIKANLISAAIINGVKQLANAIKDIAMQSITAADEIATMATKTGISTDEIQKWQYIGKALDGDIEAITGSVGKLTKSMTAAKNGTKAQSDAFKTLRVEVKNSDGSLRDSKVVMLEAFEALSKVGNETDRDSLSLIIFGKSAMELNPFIKAGSDRLNELSDAAYKNGAVMSNATVEGLDKFKDSTEMLNQEVQSMTGEILVELMPAFNEIIQWVRDNKEDIKKFATEALKAVADGFQWIIDNKDGIILGLELILGAFVALKILDAINVMVTTFNLLMATTIGTAGLFVIAAVAIVGALALLILNWDKVTNSIHRAWYELKMFLGLEKTKNTMGTTANGSGYSGGGAGAGAGGSHWATGGIFTQPTFFPKPGGYNEVGEAGAEAVLPLSRLSGIMADSFDYDRLAQANRKGMVGMYVQIGDDIIGQIVDNKLVKAMVR